MAAQLNAIVSAAMMNEMTATGGILLIGIGISSMLELKKISVGNFLPALAIAPAIVYVLGLITNSSLMAFNSGTVPPEALFASGSCLCLPDVKWQNPRRPRIGAPSSGFCCVPMSPWDYCVYGGSPWMERTRSRALWTCSLVPLKQKLYRPFRTADARWRLDWRALLPSVSYGLQLRLRFLRWSHMEGIV